MATIDFGGVKEEVVTREEFPLKKALEVLKNETIAVIGYGVQGPAQSLNMKDNGFNVIIGQASKFKKDWDRAIADGWAESVDVGGTRVEVPLRSAPNALRRLKRCFDIAS